jgi:hypothetical protein
MNEAQGGIARFLLAVNALPLPVTGLQPSDPAVTTSRPRIRFAVEAAAGPLDRLACFASNEPGPLGIEIEGRQVSVQLGHDMAPGRTRVNCTLPAPDGRWRWLGLQMHLATGG